MRMRREIDRADCLLCCVWGLMGTDWVTQVWKLRDKHMRQLMEFEVETIYNFTVHYANHVRYGIRYGIQHGRKHTRTALLRIASMRATPTRWWGSVQWAARAACIGR
jgi:hypothetical protein